jgi:formylglycine-generating enzyme required for sulfatase activity
VGSYQPNPFGLHDMAGNVFEWVQDCWHETYQGAPSDGSAWVEAQCARRVARGGSWNFLPEFLRSAYRIQLEPSARTNAVGFRVARSLDR